MSLESIYRNLLIDKYITEQLRSGIAVTAADITNYIDGSLSNLDLSVPIFNSSAQAVASKDFASISKTNDTFSTIEQDLRVLYKAFVELAKVSVEDFERWKYDIDVLERRLSRLEERIDNLLIVVQDTEGYHSFFAEDFEDMSHVDLELTNVLVDTHSRQAYLSPLLTDNLVTTRIFLNGLLDQDVSFKVRTSQDFIGRVDAENARLVNIFSQKNIAWWTQVNMSKARPVTCELSIRLSDNPIDVSSIYIALHDSVFSSPVVITPLYSIDNYNFNQLPTVSYTQEVRNTAVFNFSLVQAKYVKFLLTKAGPDPGMANKLGYQFGFKEIAFYSESFNVDVAYQLVSKPIFILNADNSKREFGLISLDVCERLEPNTAIRYFVTPSDDPTVPVSESTKWFPISPVSRVQANFPKALNLGDVDDFIATSVGVSYDGQSIDSAFVNPKQSFSLLSLGVLNNVLTETVLATSARYSFTNLDERILTHSIKDSDYVGSGTGSALDLDEDGLEIFRNVGAKGLTSVDTVRNVQRGWRFQDPYYSTTIRINNPDGLSIDVGSSFIYIDGIKHTGKIDKSVLTGETQSSTGLHAVSVHKDNWRHVTPGLATLYGTSGLIAVDPLYPYNHKLLIEGYDYSSSFPVSQEKIYLGADEFFELRMKNISLFDLTNNISEDKYRYVALDRDIPSTHTGGNSSVRVFVVKVNHENPDGVNEQFTIRANLINQRYKYLRFKAELTTESESTTPALDGYKIKFGN
jgi:hypothetical protein